MPPNEPIKGPLNLLLGAYTSRSIIAEAQRCLNLYPEKNPQDAAAPVTCYPTPGLTQVGNGPVAQPWRQLYCTSQGQLYGVCGSVLYQIGADFALTELVTLTTTTSYVSMSDNGTYLCLVDGSEFGYFVNLETSEITSIASPAWYGSPRVDQVDGFFLFSRPDTPIFYCTNNNSITFDTLDFASKNGYPDPICGVVSLHRNVWLIGTQTTEIWENVGGAQFPFQRVSGAYIEHGCVSVGSIATLGANVFWLSQDKSGARLVALGRDYNVKRVSTPAIEAEFSKYVRVDDAKGFCYQIIGHNFYFLTFPTAGKTWVYDQREDLWHELCWLDSDGVQHRHRGGAIAFAFGDQHVVGDRNNGKLYLFDQENFTDNGDPILRLRSFSHISKNGNLIAHKRIQADMEAGTSPSEDVSDLVTLRWSDSRGRAWGNGITQSIGATGQHKAIAQWRRLGRARDRVYELSWSGALFTALQGLYLEAGVEDN